MILHGPHRPDLLREETLADIFEATAGRSPDQTALIEGAQQITYRELDARANLMAHYLIGHGACPGQVVGLWLPRGSDLLATQLAIAKTGAAWLPFDADTPAERVAVCLADANAIGIITDRKSESGTQNSACLAWHSHELQQPCQENLRLRQTSNPDQPAYVIYTSGSTGKPKGVPISQRAICHFLRSENNVLGIRSTDRVYQGFSIAFDMSFEEIWISYLVGATLWLAPRTVTADPDALPRALNDNGITVLHAVPTLLGLFTQDVPGLRLINLGGEACPQRLADQWARPGRQLFNTYGPTEATVSASIAELHAGTEVTIGTPLPNYGLLVVDEALQPLPAGQTGELCITGPGVSVGYLGRPELTSAKFMINPWGSAGHDKRLYRTGDMARIDADGQVRCLGRVDDQVKVRGFRVELGEIEAALGRQPGVGTVAVVLRPVQDIEQLVAYIVPADSPPETAGLRQRLRETLPPYMVPGHFVITENLPRLTSGKIDRNTLRALAFSDTVSHDISDQPETAEEQALFAVLEKLFPGHPIRREADFFDDLGGHSLLAARLVSVLRTDSRYVHLTVNDIYKGRTLHAICQSMQPPQTPHRRDLPEWHHTPPAKRLLCGICQTISLPFVIGLHIMNWLAPFFTYHLYTGDPDDRISYAVAASVLVFLGANLFSLLMAILANRVLLLGIGAGRYPLWGITHFRWWLADRLQQASPAYLLSGSSLYTGYLRALGATIGKDVVIGSITIRQPYLLHIGEGTSIGSTVHLENVRVERGELVVGTITLGKNSYIGSYSVVEGACQIEEKGRLEGLSALAHGTHIKAGQIWEGSPAKLLTEQPPTPPVPRLAASPTRLVFENLFFMAGGALVSVLFFLPLFPAFALIDSLEGRLLAPALERHGYLLSALEYTLLAIPASAIMVIGTVLISVALRWVVLPRMKAGSWPVHSGMYCRKWLANLIQIASLQVLHGVYATIYAPAWYRMLGAQIGRHAEISTAMGIVPDMLTLGDETFIADGVMLGDEQVDGGWMSVDYTVIARRSFVGNGAYVPDGTTLPEDVLIGVQSKAPASGAMRAGQTWVGSPPVRLPSREVIRGFPEHLTFHPSAWRWIGRGFIEATRIILPLALVIGVGYVIVLDSMPFAEREDWWGLLLDLSCNGLYYGIGCFLGVVLLKWVLLGRYSPRAAPMWTPFVWISEAVTSIYESIAVPNFLEYLHGTPMLPVALRLLGAKIGRGVYMDTTDLTEFDCVQIGDYSELNAWSGPQTHLFEDRVMKVGQVNIGSHVTVGVRSTILYDSTIENNVLVGPLSLVMKGESLPPDSAWIGSPAQPWQT